jgi:hypothetical protein
MQIRILQNTRPSFSGYFHSLVAEGRVLPVSLKMGYDLPIPDPSGEFVVHEVLSPQNLGIHVHSAVGDGGYPVGTWER